jgi:RHS repeat-associated protein
MTYTRSVAISMVFAVLGSAALSADFGHTAGSFSVDPKGAANYDVNIWSPPGPLGMQPEISLYYSSNGEKGDRGVGWDGEAGIGWRIGGLGAIHRCPQTFREDGAPAPVSLGSSDKYCLDGNKLRLTSTIAYGQPDSTYQTEFADFSLITANSSEGNAPQSFTVMAKNGLIYEYGGTADSRIKPGTSTNVLRWMLSKVRDRNGNNYIVTYKASEGGAAGFSGVGLPESIQWTPTQLGATTYRYKMEFEYEVDSTKNAFYGFAGGQPIINKYRLKEIRIKSAGALMRRYALSYEQGPVTGESRLKTLRECTTSDVTNCLSPLTLDYQAGQSGVTAGTGPVPSGSGNGLLVGRYDLNGDGKDDVLYMNGGTCKAAFAANTGFTGPYNTGSTSCGIVDHFLPNGRDAIATTVNGIRMIYKWNDTTQQFDAVNTGVAGGEFYSTDYNGDGLADFISNSNTQLFIRRNTSSAASANPTFASSTFLAATLPTQGPNGQGTPRFGGLWTYFGTGLQRADVNGDGRQDIYAPVLNQFPMGATPYYMTLLATSSGYLIPSANSWAAGSPPAPALHFNDDKCTDRQVGTTIHISQCDGIAASTLTAPATPFHLLDWDGDGRTDILVNNGGTFGVYLSTGIGFGILQTSSISTAGGTFFPIDQDGDGADDLVKYTGSGSFTYWTHTNAGMVPNYATQLPDLLSKITDGLDNTIEINYTTTAEHNYSQGGATAYPTQEGDPQPIVAMVRTSTASLNADGTPNKFDRTYAYFGSRVDASLSGMGGFEKVEVTDSRDLTVQSTTYSQVFPLLGRVTHSELRQADGKKISATDFRYNGPIYIDSSQTNFRVFVYPDRITRKTFDVSLANGGAKNGAQITELVTDYLDVDLPNGNFRHVVSTLADMDSTAPASPTAGATWTTDTLLTFSPDITAANWCLGIPTSTVSTKSSSLNGSSTITRTTSRTPNYAKCRVSQEIDEPNIARYKVTTDLKYDDDAGFSDPDFGHLVQITVTGNKLVNGSPATMTPRTTRNVWSDSTRQTGQFIISATNPANETSTFDYNYDLGISNSAKDPNGLETKFGFDAFGRVIKTTYPDNTFVTNVYQSCTLAGNCSGPIKAAIVETANDAGGHPIRDSLTFLDGFGRQVDRRERVLTGELNQVRVEYDSQGRVKRVSSPCIMSGSSCSGTTFWTARNYDLAGRLTRQDRPLSSGAGNATTLIAYSGQTTTSTDAGNHDKVVVSDPTGRLRQIKDAAGYTINFGYDAAGNRTSVADNQGNSLWSGTYEYGARAFNVAYVDNDLGNWSFVYDSLGQQVAWTDAKGQSFQADYDAVSRIKSRSEPDLESTWKWGTGVDSTGATAKNIGKLEKTTAGSYSEEYFYDSLGRLKTQKIVADNTYNYDFAYDDNASTGNGLLDSITYPLSTSGYRFKLKHVYQNGLLRQLSDANSGLVFWTANSVNGFGQLTQETLGNQLITKRVFDPVTGLVSTIKTGTAANEVSVQNDSYLFDALGNLTQRANNNLFLTESAFYDNMNRLDYTSLNGGSTRNYDVDYDALGRVTRWQLDGASWNNVDYTTTDTHCQYGPNAQIHAYRKKVQGSGSSYACYDRNGNFVGGGTNGTPEPGITWTSFNQPLQMGSIPNQSQFVYNQDHQRWKQTANYNGTSEVTRYVGALMEEVTTSAGTTYRHYIPAGSSSAIYSRATFGATPIKTFYLSKDHLGSTSFITGGDGVVAYSQSFTTRGDSRRGANWTGFTAPPQPNDATNVTRRGFTGQEMLDNRVAVHLNGRVMAGQTFLSPDPFITDPTNTQNYNRYSYVYNNPLSFTAPTGFDVQCDIGGEPYGHTAFHGGGIEMPDGTTVMNWTPYFHVDGIRSPTCQWVPGPEIEINIPMPEIPDSAWPLPDPCDKFEEFMTNQMKEKEAIDKIEKMLHDAHMSNQAVEAIMDAIKDLPPGATITGVGSPQNWIWLDQRGTQRYGAPFFDLSQGSEPVIRAAHRASKFLNLTGNFVNGMMIGYELGQGHWDKAAFKSFDAMVTSAMVKYGKGYGALAAILYSAAGGSETLYRAAPPADAMKQCTAQTSGINIGG